MGDRIEPLMPADPVRGRRWPIAAASWKVLRGANAPTGPREKLSDELARCRAPTSAWSDGPSTAPGNGFCTLSRPRLTRTTTSTGPSRWTPTSSGPPAPRRGTQKKGAVGRFESADHGLGCFREGLSTKVHLAVGGRARCLAFTLTAGQAGDASTFGKVAALIRVPRTGRAGRTRPETVLADRAYCSRAIRAHLRRRGIRTVIPQPSEAPGRRSWPRRAEPRPAPCTADPAGGEALVTTTSVRASPYRQVTVVSAPGACRVTLVRAPPRTVLYTASATAPSGSASISHRTCWASWK